MASHFLSRVRHGVRRLHSTLKLGSQAPSRILSVYGIVDPWVGSVGCPGLVYILVTDGIWLRRRVNLRSGRKIIL